MGCMIKIEQALELLRGKRVVEDSREVVGIADALVWDSRIMKGGGVEFVRAALDKGATVVTDLEVQGAVRVADAGEVLARYAAGHWPKQPAKIVGVTGTAGKSSVAWFCQQIGRQMNSAAVGTLGVIREDKVVEYTGYTSPSALKVHPILQSLAEDGVGLAALEVSSHALALRRMDGVRFCAAGYTNFTQDHLDFHGSMEEYFLAKLRLFSEVLPENGLAVVNVRRQELWPILGVVKQRGGKLLSVGTSNAELVVEVVRADARGLQVNLKLDRVPVALELPLVGSFQADNLAVALGLMVGAGMAWGEIATAAAHVTSVAGRMEIVGGGKAKGQGALAKGGRPTVVVDYAHKPDALRRALEALRPMVVGSGKLRVVFGCGGNRDAGKRPIMGKIAAELADAVYVTDDNPRREEAGGIRDAVVAGVVAGGKKPRNIGDRRKAILAALNDSGPDDVVLVAGKGHEDGQIVGETVLPFDDRVVVRELLG
ncbi:MAG: UDP-N-acetylmuramoyl-L-alanyl-D-glutamate--2,6-diaminopimelate ligase [Proteobacteria bacterium]|nr:UDP-N-acetylmuramoyl-L-alanyl-D-glutamate--2,6-diaminopimelate ligase [Pseudomonadota bacterium]